MEKARFVKPSCCPATLPPPGMATSSYTSHIINTTTTTTFASFASSARAKDPTAAQNQPPRPPPQPNAGARPSAFVATRPASLYLTLPGLPLARSVASLVPFQTNERRCSTRLAVPNDSITQIRRANQSHAAIPHYEALGRANSIRTTNPRAPLVFALRPLPLTLLLAASLARSSGTPLPPHRLVNSPSSLPANSNNPPRTTSLPGLPGTAFAHLDSCRRQGQHTLPHTLHPVHPVSPVRHTSFIQDLGEVAPTRGECKHTCDV